MSHRRAPRFTVWLPVRVEELPDGMAITHNASQRGVLIVTASTLEVGAPVTLTFSGTDGAGEPRQAHGKVVRVEPNREDPDGMWRHRLAVEFDEPAEELSLTLAELAERGMATLHR
jgi:hypothetical protein